MNCVRWSVMPSPGTSEIAENRHPREGAEIAENRHPREGAEGAENRHPREGAENRLARPAGGRIRALESSSSSATMIVVRV
jgi:hypothetical protein